MSMNFEPTDRIIAVDPQQMQALYIDLLNTYGVEVQDGPRRVLTIGAHWDDAEKTRLRAASLTDGTITPEVLTDSRVAFRCLWPVALAQAFEEGAIEGVEELTEAQLAELTPQPEAAE
jgi:hypothetical protein